MTQAIAGSARAIAACMAASSLRASGSGSLASATAEPSSIAATADHCPAQELSCRNSIGFVPPSSNENIHHAVPNRHTAAPMMIHHGFGCWRSIFARNVLLAVGAPLSVFVNFPPAIGTRQPCPLRRRRRLMEESPPSASSSSQFPSSSHDIVCQSVSRTGKRGNGGTGRPRRSVRHAESRRALRRIAQFGASSSKRFDFVALVQLVNNVAHAARGAAIAKRIDIHDSRRTIILEGEPRTV